MGPQQHPPSCEHPDGYARVQNFRRGSRGARAEQKAGSAGCWALVHSMAAAGTGFPSAVTLLEPRSCGTRVGGFCVEVPGLTQIPREGPMRQKFPLRCPATGGVCFAGEEVFQSLLPRAGGWRGRKTSHSVLI